MTSVLPERKLSLEGSNPVPTNQTRDSLLDSTAMKEFLIRTFCVVLVLATCVAAQDVLPLYPGTPPGSAQENYPEKEYFSKTWNTEVVANVTKSNPDSFQAFSGAEKRDGRGDLSWRWFYGTLHQQRRQRCS
jgi:hypothetical protein